MAGGRSLHASEGVVLYSLQSVFDTAVTPAVPLGIVGFNATDDADFRQFFTVGKKNLHQNKAGIARVDWQVQLPAVASMDHLLLGIRSSGQLPWVTWGFGSDPVDASPEAWQVADCKVDQMEISLDGGGGILSASLQGIGRTKTTITTLDASEAAAGTDEPLGGYEAKIELAGSGFEIHSFRVSVNHNLLMESVLRGTTLADAKLRLWDYLTEGNEDISGSVVMARKHSKDFQAKCPAEDGDLVITLTPACSGVDPFTITLADVEFLSQARNMPNEGYGNFEMPFNAKGIDIAAVV